jgi:hydrogenase small subunit
VSGSSPVIALPGCPANAANIAALVVHYVTFGDLPPTDLAGRPLFAYGDLIHNKCERRPHFEFGEFALTWGDEGAQKGWCLYKLGCKGPETMGNCPTVRYGGGVSWNIRAGHGCIGCFAPGFWDGGYLPAYERLPPPVPPFPAITVDQLGVAAVAGIGAVAVAHGTGMAVRSAHRRRSERRRAALATLDQVSASEPAATAASIEEPATVGPAPDGTTPTVPAPEEPAVEPSAPEAALDEAPPETTLDEAPPEAGPEAPR